MNNRGGREPTRRDQPVLSIRRADLTAPGRATPLALRKLALRTQNRVQAKDPRGAGGGFWDEGVSRAVLARLSGTEKRVAEDDAAPGPAYRRLVPTKEQRLYGRARRAAPRTPALSPSAFFTMGVRSSSLKTHRATEAGPSW